MNLQEHIRRILREEISAKDAYNEYDSIKTIVDGKRDVAFTTLESPTTKFMIFINGLKKIKVESENETNYIVYKKRSEDLAKELLNIANKYGGKLRFDATDEDSRRIGQILNYNPKEIEDYILHNKKIRNLENNQSEEQLQESIRRILRENKSNPINSIKRRLDVVDWLVDFSVREIERQYNGICNTRTPENFVETVIEKVGDGMYWDYFANIDDDSKEWEEMYRFISIYVYNKFDDKLRQHYHMQCGD